MSETNLAQDDSSSLVRVLQEISGKLSILEEINANMNKLERRLEQERPERQKLKDEHSAPIAVDDTTHFREKDAKEPADTVDSDPDSTSEKLENNVETKYYMLDKADFSHLESKTWVGSLEPPLLSIDINDYVIPVEGNSDYSVSNSFPASTSQADWSYYKPVYNYPTKYAIDELHGYWNRGIGKPNFVGEWEKEGMEEEPTYAYTYKEKEVSLIPYSSTPPFKLNFCEAYRKYPRYGTFFKNEIDDIIPGIWTLPPDLRLNLDFQHHVLCQRDLGEDKEEALRKLARDIRAQHKRFDDIGAHYTVTEIDPRGTYITYSVLEAPSALEVEEWCLNISPKAFTTPREGSPKIDGFPCVRAVDDVPWSRVISICGFAVVYKQAPWGDRGIDFLFSRELCDDLFEFHTTCKLKAHQRFRKPTMFHVCWMDIQYPYCTQLHDGWNRENLLGDKARNIGRVAGSVQYFVSASGDEHEFGTVLVLAPADFRPPLKEQDSSHLNLWLALATTIHGLMEAAAISWEEISKYLRELLSISNPQGLHIDEENFSDFTNVLWVISKLDEIIPMVQDSVEQWEYFQAGNSKMRPTTQYNLSLERPRINDNDSDKQENSKDRLNRLLNSKLQQLNIVRDRLKICEEEFIALSNRAHLLNDSLRELSKIEDSILNANIALLTYATIFFLPLTFCTSLWVVNNMFGTGGRGFAIITAVIPVITYAIVFNLLHPSTKKGMASAIKKVVTLPWLLWKKVRPGKEEKSQV